MRSINTELLETIFEMSRVMKEKTEEALQKTSLSVLQLHTLFYLRDHPDVQMNEIAKTLKIELPSATSLINKLVSVKFAQRSEDKKDRRIVRISLTPKGLKILDEAIKQRKKHIEKNLSYLSDSEKENLLLILKKMIDKIK